MFKQTVFGVITLMVAMTAFAETQCMAYPEKEHIPEAKFQEQLKQQGYQIKRFKVSKGNCYEIYGKNKQGQKVEIYFDAKTGKVVKSEID